LALDQEASGKTLRGIGLLAGGDEAVLPEAIRLFDDAIAIRMRLPWRNHPWIRYGLVAGWLNRGEALTRLGGKKELLEARENYDTALELLRELPVEAHQLFLKRHLIAWANRGQTLAALEDFSGAVQSFEKAREFLNGMAVRDAATELLLAGVRTNLGNVLLMLKPAESQRALELARLSLQATGEWEEQDLLAAEISLKARHVLCRAAAELLEEWREPGRAAALAAEATDSVEDGLRLGRHWGRKGEFRFDPLVLDLFRFGGRVYQRYQPQFLGEFILDTLEDQAGEGTGKMDPRLYALAREALGREMADIQRNAFVSLNSPKFEDLLQRVRSLRMVEERLLHLRKKAGPSALPS